MKSTRTTAHDAAAGPLEVLRRRAEKLTPDEADRGLDDANALAPAAVQRKLHELQVQQIELELQNEELRQAQDALDASRARYFDLYDLAPVGYFTLDEAGLILEANLTGAALLGVARGALVQQPLSRFVVGKDADNYYLHYKQLLKTGEPQAFELRLSRKECAPFNAWIETTIAPGERGARACRVMVSDISERRVVQEKLRYNERLLHTAGAIARVGGWAVKLPGNELVWSDEICAILDFPIGAVPQLADALTLYPPASREIIAGALTLCARDGTPFDCELEIFTAKRRRLDVRAKGLAVRDEDGNITGIEGAFQDITERKKSEQARTSLEAQLRESQKMEAIGTLAGGIAHDFNNILATILGNVELARQDSRANWQALVSLDEIQKAGNRARDLVQQILSFSRRKPTTRRLISTLSIVEESARLLRAALPREVRVECRCGPDITAIMADPTQVQQVLLNLGTNAAQAMEGRAGNIDICCEDITLDAASARIDLNLRPGRYSRVAISDTGHGMDGATQRRIFEPFFTTKPAGKGTGLGLSVAHSIMQGHEGAIVAHSDPGTGSRFELYFPLAPAVTSALGTPEPATPTGEGRGQHILYLDDDEAQVFLLKRLMERWGYRVSTYQEQRAALDALLASDQRVDVVVTDFTMPGISGLDVARAIREARPDLPVIVVSGYITDSLREQAQAAGVRKLIAKPHDLEELRDVLQGLLAPREAASQPHSV